MRKITETAKKIKAERGFDSNAFWEHQKMMNGKKPEIATAMKTESGEIEEDSSKCREIYQSFYIKLLKDRKPDNEEEQKLQENKEKCIELMKKRSERKRIQPISKEEYSTMKRQLKKKKAPDKESWRYEWIIHAGKDLEQSILFMLNQILKVKTPPIEWHNMRIKSASRNLQKKNGM